MSFTFLSTFSTLVYCTDLTCTQNSLEFRFWNRLFFHNNNDGKFLRSYKRMLTFTKMCISKSIISKNRSVQNRSLFFEMTYLLSDRLWRDSFYKMTLRSDQFFEAMNLKSSWSKNLFSWWRSFWPRRLSSSLGRFTFPVGF